MLVLLGVSALTGGVILMLDPSGGTLGLSAEWLHPSPFSDYFIPGVVLALGGGLYPLAILVSALRRFRHAPLLALDAGSFLLIWMVFQVYWIGYRSILQPIAAAYACILMLSAWKWMRSSGIRSP